MRSRFACLLLGLTALSSVGHAQTAGPRLGELTDRAPTASFDLDLRAGQIVTLTAGGEVDTILTLYGPDGREIAQNDDVEPGDLSSRIIHAAQTPGRYRAVVSGYGGATGAFTFEMEDGVDFDLSWEARELDEQVVSLSRGRTEIRVPVSLNAEENFVASTFALTEGLDTTLELLDASGQSVAENDDRGDGSLNSQIAYRPLAAGPYTLVVSSFSGEDSGDLLLSTAIDPNADIPFDFASIEREPFQRTAGALTQAEPERAYSFELAAGQTLLALADADDEALDPILTLRGPDGLTVALNDDRGDGSLNSAIAYTAPQNGDYSLEVSGYGTTLGGYSLEVAMVDASVVDILRTVFEGRVILSGPERVIETENFRLGYTLEGDDATTEEFARLTAETLQRAYSTQIGEMGWAAPIVGSDGRYRAYIAEAGDAMGFAAPIEMLFDNPNTPDVRENVVSRARLVIDNDLSQGRDQTAEVLMHATVVHEFGHVVQFGYASEEELNWLYESTASWIEIATAGDDEDASRYSETDFASPQLCWTTSAEGHDYGQWTLLQSLADTHGQRIVVRLWENAALYDGMDVMTRTLAEVGTTTPEAIRRWRIQNFARGYALAPRFDWAVASGGQIKRQGVWSTGEPIEQLGASYLQLRLAGPHRFSLRDGEGFELVGLGVREGQVEVVPLGRDGVFNTAGYDYAGLMVFNGNEPARPGDCAGEEYQIEVASAPGGASAVAYRVPAPHFLAPGSTPLHGEMESPHDH
ncbi:DVUA0089 family protein [Brevundimonas sp.]|uniref:DVUA0089 family protein n=1 Tax=Brevundimonas sp. TaxID=1871086 RepID=UPI0025D320E6|nr:DVUA0089 family protein [Brevundimonas sp.]